MAENIGSISITFLNYSFISKKTKVQSWGTGEASWKYKKVVEYLCDSQNDCFDFCFLLKRLTLDRWQYIFEGLYIFNNFLLNLKIVENFLKKRGIKNHPSSRSISRCLFNYKSKSIQKITDSLDCSINIQTVQRGHQ